MGLIGLRNCPCHVFDTLGYEVTKYKNDSGLPYQQVALCPVASVQSSFAAANKNVGVCELPGEPPWSIGVSVFDDVPSLASPFNNPVNPVGYVDPAQMSGVILARLATDPESLKYRYAIYEFAYYTDEGGQDPNSFGATAAKIDLSMHPPTLVGVYPYPAELRHVLVFVDAARLATGAAFYDGYYPVCSWIGVNPDGIIWWGHGPNVHSIVRFRFSDNSYTWGGNVIVEENVAEIQLPARRAEDFWVIAWDVDNDKLATGIWTGTAGDYTYSQDTGNLPAAILTAGEIRNIVSDATGYPTGEWVAIVDYTRANGRDYILLRSSGSAYWYFDGTAWNDAPFEAQTVDADADGNVYLASSSLVERVGAGGWSVAAIGGGLFVQNGPLLSFNKHWVHAKGFSSGWALGYSSDLNIQHCGEGAADPDFAVFEPWYISENFVSGRFVGWSLKRDDGSVQVPHRSRAWGAIYGGAETDYFSHNYYTGKKTWTEIGDFSESKAQEFFLGVNANFDAIPCDCGQCVPDPTFY